MLSKEKERVMKILLPFEYDVAMLKMTVSMHFIFVEERFSRVALDFKSQCYRNLRRRFVDL